MVTRATGARNRDVPRAQQVRHRLFPPLPLTSSMRPNGTRFPAPWEVLSPMPTCTNWGLRHKYETVL
jgi:hypothetical protein